MVTVRVVDLQPRSAKLLEDFHVHPKYRPLAIRAVHQYGGTFRGKLLSLQDRQSHCHQHGKTERAHQQEPATVHINVSSRNSIRQKNRRRTDRIKA